MDRSVTQRNRPLTKQSPTVSTRSEHSPPLILSSKLLNISEKLLNVRPLTLLSDALVVPAIERLALVEDAFVNLPIVRLFDNYGISPTLLSVLAIVFSSVQLKKALATQRDFTLLLLGTVWPVWRTVSLPDAAAKPRRIESFWVIFAALNAFDSMRVHPHPLESQVAPSVPITSTIYYRLRPLLQLAERAQQAVQRRVKGAAYVPPARLTAFPEPLPYYRTASLPVSTMPRLSLALRTFGLSWPYLKLIMLWAVSLNDFSLANRLLTPFRSPRPRPPGRRIVTVVTLHDAQNPTLSSTLSDEDRPSLTPPPSPPKTPEVPHHGEFRVLGGESSSDLADAHRVWAKGHYVDSES